jgi:hypothetical protein
MQPKLAQQPTVFKNNCARLLITTADSVTAGSVGQKTEKTEKRK